MKSICISPKFKNATQTQHVIEMQEYGTILQTQTNQNKEMERIRKSIWNSFQSLIEKFIFL